MIIPDIPMDALMEDISTGRLKEGKGKGKDKNKDKGKDKGKDKDNGKGKGKGKGKDKDKEEGGRDMVEIDRMEEMDIHPTVLRAKGATLMTGGEKNDM